MTIDILLTVYNGLPFLREQIGSLQAQTHEQWRLWVRDDGSTDGTPEAVRALAAADPRIRLLPTAGENLGCAGGFAWLMEQVEPASGYVMFCDADDVWEPAKIASTLAGMRSAEARYGAGTPLLVHTDLRVVDAELREIHSSFWGYQRIRPERATLRRLLVQNTVTGCTAMVNRALLEKALPVPPEAVMHDWWAALVATVFGRIVPLPEARILYRQHGRNVVGAHLVGRGVGELVRKLGAARDNTPRLRASIRAAAAQAEALLRSYGPELEPAQRDLLRRFAEIPECGLLRRKLRLLKLRTMAEHGIARNLGVLLRA